MNVTITNNGKQLCDNPIIKNKEYLEFIENMKTSKNKIIQLATKDIRPIA